jgi:hypothetical protein
VTWERPPQRMTKHLIEMEDMISIRPRAPGASQEQFSLKKSGFAVSLCRRLVRYRPGLHGDSADL